MRRVLEGNLTLGWLKKLIPRMRPLVTEKGPENVKVKCQISAPTEQLCDNQTLSKQIQSCKPLTLLILKILWKKGLDNVTGKLIVKLQLCHLLDKQFCDGEKMTEHLHASASLSVKRRCIIVSIINFPWRLNEYLIPS